MTEVPRRMEDPDSLVKRRAPTLYLIIAIKLLKGTVLVVLAVLAFSLSNNDLPAEFQGLLQWFRIDPEKKFWSTLAVQVGKVTHANVVWVAMGTLTYSLFSWVEGVGLIFRARWAGWLAIGESAFFIPIEVFELVRRFSFGLLGILAVNVFIVWYLFQNKERLFRHHH